MEKTEKNYAYIWDMFIASQRIQEFTKNMTWEDYKENILVQSAVSATIRNFRGSRTQNFS